VLEDTLLSTAAGGDTTSGTLVTDDDVGSGWDTFRIIGVSDGRLYSLKNRQRIFQSTANPL